MLLCSFITYIYINIYIEREGFYLYYLKGGIVNNNDNNVFIQ